MPKVLDRCVRRVRKQGKSRSAAFAICSSSTGYVRKKGGGWRKKRRRRSR